MKFISKKKEKKKGHHQNINALEHMKKFSRLYWFSIK